MRAKLVAIGDLCLAVLTPAMTTCCVGIVLVDFITRRIPYISSTLSSTRCDMKEHMLQLMTMGSCSSRCGHMQYISNDKCRHLLSAKQITRLS